MMDTAKDIADTASLGIVLATLLSWLPAIASLLSIVWTLLRIYDWMKKNNVCLFKWLKARKEK